ncbi:MAG: VCBS repeat-containing protein [Planctomycetota bacterium]|nr:MAG: VCBS repeat-containing protein [Planctomycetota bacterium]
MSSSCRVAAAQSALFDWYGSGQPDFLGRSPTIVGDTNADGYADIAAGNGEYVMLFSGQSGLPLHTFYEAGQTSYGFNVFDVGDVNADGVADLAAGDPNWGLGSAGAVFVYSGADYSKLHALFGDSNGDNMGTAVAGCGDVDGDGFGDIIVGVYKDALASVVQGSTRVFSGRTGAELHRFWGDAVPLQGSGYAVAGVGDVNSDGIPDIMYGSWTGKYARVRSGKDGTQIGGASGGSVTFGQSMTGPADVDADGVPDLVVGEYCFSQAQLPSSCDGAVHFHSGSSGARIATIVDNVVLGEFGRLLDVAGDVNGDGHDDVIVGAPAIATITSGAPQPGKLCVVSGATHGFLHAVEGVAPGDGFGSGVAGGGDVNGDGALDFVAYSPGDDTLGDGWGRLTAISSVPLTLVAAPHAIPAATGGTQLLRLSASSTHAGAFYLLLGSVSGSKPGVAVDSLLFPLNVDPYLMYTLSNPNSPPLSGSLGLLSQTGTALATFSWPGPVPSALLGMTGHHAYVLLGAGAVTLTSNAVPVSFVP